MLLSYMMFCCAVLIDAPRFRCRHQPFFMRRADMLTPLIDARSPRAIDDYAEIFDADDICRARRRAMLLMPPHAIRRADTFHICCCDIESRRLLDDMLIAPPPPRH